MTSQIQGNDFKNLAYLLNTERKTSECKEIISKSENTSLIKRFHSESKRCWWNALTVLSIQCLSIA
jgi:hypothetical protein